MARVPRKSQGVFTGWNHILSKEREPKRAIEEAEELGEGLVVIDVSEHKPRRIPSKKWRDLIKKVWEVDPPSGDWVYEPVEQDPFPDYDSEAVLFYVET